MAVGRISKMRDIPNLDLVRSIAVISVAVEHFLLDLGIQYIGPFEVGWMGVLGVVVFFVLTSLVLMWSLERKPHTLDFYIRRVFRIYPLAWAAMAVALLLHAPLGGPPSHPFENRAPHTFYHVGQQATLFPTMGESIEGVMWSLTYEIGMYVLLPLLFFFVQKNFAEWPLVVMWVLAVFCCRNTDTMNLQFGMGIPFFIPGILSYVGFARWRPSLPGWLLGVFLLALWVVFFYKCNYHRLWWFGLIVGCALPLFRQIQWEPLKAVSRIIARYSYGIYLMHPFAYAAGLYLLRGHSRALQFSVSFTLLIVLPVIAYHLLEAPMIRLGSRLANKAERTYEQREMTATFRVPASS